MAKVLIADDQESMRIIIAGMLRESGHEVETVEDGRAAFDKLNAGSYDLVVADVNMPKLNGLEFLAKVREKVVFVTGLLEETVKLGSEKLGLNGLILKPFDKTAALEKITRILAQ